ncbi:MAG: hypothetical protein PVI04_09585, partial [Anaerolineales bacterium]
TWLIERNKIQAKTAAPTGQPSCFNKNPGDKAEERGDVDPRYYDTEREWLPPGMRFDTQQTTR